MSLAFAGDDPEEKFIALIDDTTAFGCPHHNHSKHRVSVEGLTWAQAKQLRKIINLIIKLNLKK